MLYTIHAKIDKENDLVNAIHQKLDSDSYDEVFTIKYENVLRRDGVYRIDKRILFPTYVFIESENPDEIFSKINSDKYFDPYVQKNEYGILIYPLDEADEELINELTDENEDHVVTLSKVSYNDNRRIAEAIGPLKYFVDMIHEVDYRHRRAFVEIEIFGKTRRVAFGIFTAEDGVMQEM